MSDSTSNIPWIIFHKFVQKSRKLVQYLSKKLSNSYPKKQWLICPEFCPQSVLAISDNSFGHFVDDTLDRDRKILQIFFLDLEFRFQENINYNNRKWLELHVFRVNNVGNHLTFEQDLDFWNWDQSRVTSQYIHVYNFHLAKKITIPHHFFLFFDTPKAVIGMD